MTIRKGHSFPAGHGFTGSAGKVPVRPYMRNTPVRSAFPPKAGNLAIMRDPIDEGIVHRGMNRGGRVSKKCY